MHHAGCHGSMTEGGVVIGIENGDGRLIENSNSGLIDDGSLGIIQNRDRGLADIGLFRTAIGVASEVIATDQQRLQYGIIGIDAGINDGDGCSGSGCVIHGVRSIAANQLHGRLGDVAFPNGAAVVADCGAVAQVRRRRSGR